MRVVLKCLRKAIPIVCVGGMVIVISGIAAPSWSASDPSSPPTQQSSGATSDSSSTSGKEPEGKRGRAARKACAEDVKKFCPEVKAGEGRIVQCLKQHAQDLSPNCAEMMQQRGKRRE